MATTLQKAKAKLKASFAVIANGMKIYENILALIEAVAVPETKEVVGSGTTTQDDDFANARIVAIYADGERLSRTKYTNNVPDTGIITHAEDMTGVALIIDYVPA